MILLSQELPLSISLNQDTYRNAAQFQQAYGDLLPKEAQKVLADFAQIPKMRKIARVRALRKGGFRMQSKAARAGMMLFG